MENPKTTLPMVVAVITRMHKDADVSKLVIVDEAVFLSQTLDCDY